MHFEQFNLACLSQLSYLVGDGGVCAIVDPRRDVDVYLEAAEQRGLRITHVIETHLHADFVSGHVELARRTGAQVLVGRRAPVEYEHVPVGHGDTIRLGDITLRFLETPGHTPESVCVLVEEDGRATRVLTGDTLFIGDVGRPDLVGSKGHTAEDMAGMLYDSLRHKLLPLGDDVEVFPGHGAGSACGRNISSATSCTMGRQRETNHALQPMERAEFVARMTTGLQPPPAYFSHDAELNRRGAEPLDALPALDALDPDAVERAVAGGAWLLDVRGARTWSAGHLPGSICLGLDGNLASWAGNLLPVDADIVVIADDLDAARTARLRLARVGLHGVVGWLADGVDGWGASGRELLVQAGRPAAQWAGDGRLLVDVRGPGEWEAGHIPGARNAALPGLPDALADVDRDAPVAVVCQTGYRSAAAASVLRRAGFTDVLDLTGGTAAWIEADQPVDVPAGAGPA